MKTIALLVSLVLALVPIQAIKSNVTQTLVYGRIFKLESGQTLVFPDTILGRGVMEPTNINSEISGLEVNVNAKFTSGDDFVGIGTLDTYAGCFDPYWCQIGAVDWDYGSLRNGKLVFAGSSMNLDTKKARVLKAGISSNLYELEGSEVDIFGKRDANGFQVYAISSSDSSYSRFCGTITGKQETGITDFVVSKTFGKGSVEKITVLAQKNPKTFFFNGSGSTTFDSLQTGRLGYCAGPFNRQSGIMQASVIVSGLNASVFGGRIAGVVTSVGQNLIEIRTMLPGCVPVTVKCKLEGTQVTKNNVHLTGNQTSPYDFAIPGKTVVELFGKFENDQFTFKASLLRVDPIALSKYVCGFFTGKSIRNVFGRTTRYDPLSSMMVIIGKESTEDGTLITGWEESGKMVAAMFPEIGILGVQIKGILKENRKDSFVLECQSAFDERLSGRTYHAFLTNTSRIVNPKKGFVTPQSVEPGTVLNCWGILDEDFRFKIVLADLD